ncbi:MAG: YrdB family protein [Anaerolineae bacterium]|nr:YrdB family protein [Anaerolineae bacterium]
MGAHPVNLIIRFILELSALASLAYWGWVRGEGWFRLGLAVGLPLVVAMLWGIFAVPDDPSRSGKAPVPVPGAARLILELAFFAWAVWALYDTGLTALSLIMAVVVVIHYAASYDRIVWLVRR